MTDDSLRARAEAFVTQDRCAKLLGQELRFEVLGPAHSAHIIRWRNDPANNRNFVAHNLLTEKDQERFLESYWGRDRIDFVLALDKVGPVGVFSITGLSTEKPEIGKMIGDAEMRGRGYAKLGTLALIAFGFDGVGLRRLYAKTRVDNIGNIKLNEKLGFAVESTESIDAVDYYWMKLERGAAARP